MGILIADDERPAREKIRRFLHAEPDAFVIFEAGDGARALEVVRAERPDIVFLDIRMPGIDGLRVAESLPEGDGPALVFATAFDEHAVRAFDLHAVDYLLKPFDRERFTHALRRARERLDRQESGGDFERLRRIVDRLAQVPVGHGEMIDRLLVEIGGRSRLVPVARIGRFEAARNYVLVLTDEGPHRIRGTLADLERRLDPRMFARINRSQIVNLDWIEELEAAGHGDIDVRLRGGDVVRLSRRYRDRLAQWRA